MDVFHKVLIGVFESVDGKENGVADLKEIVKKEGFLSNIDSINDHLCSEGWVAATERQNVVKLTHWGVAEAKRTLTDSPDKNAEVEKASKKLLAGARELVIMLEEFSANPSKEKLNVVDKRVAELKAIADAVSRHY